MICTHKKFDDLIEAIESLQRQTYEDLEIVVVVDGNEELCNKILGSGIRADKLILNEENLGLSESRNAGIKMASGEVIAFFDDDAVADINWARELVKMYEDRDAIAAGGKILPLWLSNEPEFLPEEYYWLIGATHRGFAQEVKEVRNTFGSNISFRADVIKALGGFKGKMGLRGKGLLQAEETEFCERMRLLFGRGVMYNPSAVVYHKIYPERLKIGFLLRRAFWQGYSKRMMKEMGYPIIEEGNFLKELIFKGIPERMMNGKIKQLGSLMILTAAVGIGYLSGFTSRWR